MAKQVQKLTGLGQRPDTHVTTAGGRGEFSWENVRNDKDREYYLGHSVK
jgi:hypothetical protein